MKRDAAEPLKDRHIRSALVAYLRQHDRSAAILHELPLSRGARRADVVRVNGSLDGYEIKSEQDSLTRLVAQADEYEKICEYISVVITERHLIQAKKALGSHWGVIVAKPWGSGVRFHVHRKAKRNRQLDARTLVRVLWKTECVNALREMGIPTRRDTPVLELWERLAVLPAADVCAHLRNALKARNGLPIDPAHTQDGA